jgi:hypothetical protein
VLACSFPGERATAAEENLEAAAEAGLELPWCVLMTKEALESEIVDELRSIALGELSSRKPKMRFRFVRAIGGPLDGQISLVFENLTYTDQYYVYVALIRDKGLEHVYRIGGLFYPDSECKSERLNNPSKAD